MKGEHLLYIDQYGNRFGAKTIKELKEEVCPFLKSPKVSKMYQDTREGKTMHVGYIVGNHWLTAYRAVRIPA